MLCCPDFGYRLTRYRLARIWFAFFFYVFFFSFVIFYIFFFLIFFTFFCLFFFSLPRFFFSLHPSAFFSLGFFFSSFFYCSFVACFLALLFSSPLKGKNFPSRFACFVQSFLFHCSLGELIVLETQLYSVQFSALQLTFFCTFILPLQSFSFYSCHSVLLDSLLVPNSCPKKDKAYI